MSSYSNELLIAISSAMSRNNDELIYFDKKKNDVVMYVNGYFSSMIDNQEFANRDLLAKIQIGTPKDYFDEGRYILIEKISLKEFLEEYKVQTKGEEPFLGFAELFGYELLQIHFQTQPNLNINDISLNFNNQDIFHKLFSDRYKDDAELLGEKYSSIFNNTLDNLAINYLDKICEEPNLTVDLETTICNEFVKLFKMELEEKFNTKIYDCGFYSKYSDDFKKFQPLGAIPPENAEYLFYFLVPIDDEDNIVTNNYYELYNKTKNGIMFSSSNRQSVFEFQQNLKEDSQVLNYIAKQMETDVYPIGALRVNQYFEYDNIVQNAEKIDDLRYRFFRFYQPKMTI